MRSRRTAYMLHKLRVGLRRRCPECEQGRLFESYFRMRAVCSYCEARFSRHSGDAIGSVYINVALAELTALMGFFLLHAVTDIPIIHQLVIWIPYLVIFTIAFYPLARGLWVSVLYLTGGIYPDPDYQNEYIAPYHHKTMISLDLDQPTHGE
ncbi:MAG: DUF983 domain-containing protein [Chloroflexota bacterium]